MPDNPNIVTVPNPFIDDQTATNAPGISQQNSGWMPSVEPQEQSQFTFDNNASSSPQLPMDVTNNRAARYDYALGNKSPGIDNLKQAIVTGQEQDSRIQAVMSQDITDQDTRDKLISDYAKSVGPDGVSPDAADMMLHIATAKNNELNPNTFFEKKYAERITQQTLSLDHNDTYAYAQAEGKQGEYFDRLETHQKAIANQQIAQKLLEETDAKFSGQTWRNNPLDKTIDLIQSLTPFAQWVILGSGSSRAKQYQDLYSLPSDQFEEKARAELAKLEAAPDMAINYAHGLVSYSSSDKFLDNFIAYSDPVFILGGEAISRGVSLAGRRLGFIKPTATANMDEMMKTLAGETTRPNPDPARVIDISNPELAAQINAKRELDRLSGVSSNIAVTAGTTNQSSEWNDLARGLFGIHNPMAYIESGSQSLTSANQMGRFVNNLASKTANVLDNVFVNPLTVNRLTDDEARAAFAREQERFTYEYPQLNNSVLRVTPVNAQFTAAKTDALAIDLGRTDGTFFDSPQEAYAFGTRNGFSGFKIFRDRAGEIPGRIPIAPTREMGLENFLGTAEKATESVGAQSAPSIIPVNNGWALRVTRYVNEADPTVRNSLAIQLGPRGLPEVAANEQGFIGAWVNQQFPEIAGFLRSKKDLVGQPIAKYLDVTAVGNNGMQRALKSMFDEISAIPKNSATNVFQNLNGKNGSRKDFLAYLSRQQTYRDPATGVLGRFDSTVAEFERNYLREIKRLPTETETKAYFAYTHLNNIDYTALNSGILRDKARLGISDFSFPYIKRMERDPLATYDTLDQAHAAADGTPTKAMTPSIDGKIVHPNELDNVYNSKFGANILQWDHDPRAMTNQYKFTRLDNLKREDLQKQLDNGYRLVKIHDTYGHQTLKDMGDDLGFPSNMLAGNKRINYVLTKNFDQSPLKLQQIPYRAGGHLQLKDPWILSQPNIGRQTARNYRGAEHTWYNDINVYSGKFEGDLKAFREQWEEGRKVYNDDPTKFGQWVKDTGFPISEQRWKDLHEGADALLDPHTPVYVRPINSSTFDYAKLHAELDANGNSLYPNLRRANDSDHSLFGNQVNLKYATDRGDMILGIKNRGTRQTPVFSETKANYIDPVSALQQSVSNATRGRQLDDLKLMVSEKYIQAFKDVLKSDVTTLRRNPFQALVDGELKTIKQGADKQLYSAAKLYRRSALEFMNMNSPGQETLNHLKETVAQMVYNRLGEKAYDAVEPWMRTTSPAAWTRSVVFDTGKFLSPDQIIMQGISAQHNLAVLGPVKGMQALSGATLLGALGSNATDDAIRTAARIGRNMGYSHIEEAYRALERTNFRFVGRETADLNNFDHISVSDGLFNDIRDKGRVFFKIGEGYSRFSAWAGAYQEWREANPLKKLADRDIADVLSRADDLSMNMMASSAAAWQKGIASIPTQYMSWSVRLMEQMMPGWSSRLSAREKLTAFNTYGLMYGYPLAATAVVGGIPLYKAVDKYLLENYPNTMSDSNALFETLHRGLLQTVLHHLTGKDYNFSERFGTNGFSQIYDMIEGNKTVWQILGGASASTISNVSNAMAPFIRHTMSVFNDKDEQFPLTDEDFKNVLGTVRSFNNAMKAWTAMSVGSYYSKNGIELKHGTDAGDALMIFLLGAAPQDVQNSFTQLDSNKDLANLQKAFKPDIISNLRLYAKEAADGNFEDADKYLRRVKAYYVSGGYNEADQQRIFGEAFKGPFEDAITRAQVKFDQMHPDTADKRREGRD